VPQIRVALAGDVMATRGSLITADPRSMALKELLTGSDFAVANLEVVPSEGEGFPESDALSGGCLIADSSVLGAVRAMGFTMVGCANNHAMDMGTGGLQATMRLLRASRIPFAGIGRTLTEARMPGYCDGPYGSLALISCASTFTQGHEAAEPSGQLPGRPGLNPLRHRTTLRVTPEQMSILLDIDRDTGLLAMRAETATLLGLDPARAIPGCLSLPGAWFQVGEAAGMQTRCDPLDLAEISGWVRDARQRADVVIVSVHTHEAGLSPRDPSEFIREFAHQMIDSGADTVAGHGCHFLRGVEMYRGKPVFYGLGNIVSQIELSVMVPAEDYARVPAADRASPSRYFAARSKGGTVLFAPHRKYWESVVPVLTFDDGALVSAVLHPVDLGFGAALHCRGRPQVAEPDRGAEIVCEVARMSAAYDTHVSREKLEDGIVGVIKGSA
jgi:Bacterial capsule synthesis protein PGA_cap